MRIDKYICESTELSRSDAKKALKRRGVTCDGDVILKADFKVPEGALVRMEGVTLQPRGTRYIMLNKPLDTVCSNVDEESYDSVLSLLDLDKAKVLKIAGRLDVDTTGLVLITDDGQWAHRVTSPNKEYGKRYWVKLENHIPEIEFDSITRQFSEGLQLRNETDLTKSAKLEIIASDEVLLTLYEGKYHQVKRMMAAVNNKVIGLHREQIGTIELDESLELGQWRYLTNEEVAYFAR
ncbi:16S rRNA pseudouridine(516) synthase [Endozoicomonas sp. (ex Bugula neritina AB1)]|nr:16S rRNA pseudouridine(516) synthase [Endozoicomonas sp. (ex Bugula neritina AB1)]